VHANTQANFQKHFKAWGRYGQEGKGLLKFWEEKENEGDTSCSFQDSAFFKGKEQSHFGK